jgi:hypothetical protein
MVAPMKMLASLFLSLTTDMTDFAIFDDLIKQGDSYLSLDDKFIHVIIDLIRVRSLSICG